MNTKDPSADNCEMAITKKELERMNRDQNHKL